MTEAKYTTNVNWIKFKIEFKIDQKVGFTWNRPLSSSGKNLLTFVTQGLVNVDS